MNRATTHASISPDSVMRRLPPRFRECVNSALITTDRLDLLVFESGEDTIATSTDLASALDALVHPCPRWVAVGEGFTLEARQLASSRGGLVFASQKAEYDWTDETWTRIQRGLRM